MEKRGASGGREVERIMMIKPFLSLLLLGFLASSAHAHFGSCEDHTPLCPVYARRGHCNSRRQYMLQNCPVSCDACVDPDCYDRSNRCSGSAQQGLCESQKSFMLQQCPHSCDSCRIGVSNAVALTNLRTIISPNFECGRPITQASRFKRQIIFPDEFDSLTMSTRSGSSQPPRTQAVEGSADGVVTLLMPGAANNLNVEDTFCGATPITDRFLLTAAHCVFDPERPATTVRLGELDFAKHGEANSNPVDYTVEQIYVHPDYDPSSLVRYNDVAIIQTVERMRFNELVYPYCISENSPAPGTLVTGAGFGLVNATFRPTQLQEARLEVLESSRCENLFREEQYIPQLMVRYPELLQGKSIICATYPRTSACMGDSGGPLYEVRNGRRYLVGIVSTGVSCRGNGISTLPGLYINVADHVEFIDSVVYSPALV